MLPRSGRDGFLLYDGVYTPIYNWTFSTSRQREAYAKASSGSKIYRNKGIVEERVRIKGANYVPDFWEAIYGDYISFWIGWFDFVDDDIKYIPIDAVLSRLSLHYIYSVSPSPSFYWEAEFTGVLSTKIIGETVDLSEFGDNILCSTKACDRVVTTSDATLNSGVVKHVYQADINFVSTRESYAIASSNNRIVNTLGIVDITASLGIHGDFDYWIEAVENGDTSKIYRFYYSATQYWELNSMVVLGVDNFLVNVETAEMMSATVNLGLQA